MSEHESQHQLPRQTTPTWEVELLISGVAVFAMLQLPGTLDEAFFWMEPRLAGDWRQVVLLAYIYSKSAALILAATFVSHLLLRARWIALVGMHSVYPDGILWHKLKMSPIQREIERELDTPFSDLIERADNLATTVFSIGVMLAILMGAVAIGAITIFGASVLLASIPGGRLSSYSWLWILVIAIMLPYGVAIGLDHWRGAHWRPENGARRLVQAVLRLYGRIGFARGSNPIMAMLASHDGDRKAMLLTTGLMTLSLLAGMFGVLTLKFSNHVGSYSMFPWADAALPDVDSAHYDDQRDPLRDGLAPYIPNIAPHGAYVKLVVPYQPRLDEPAMRERCGHADALQKLEQSKALLDCLSALHPVSLDGLQLEALRYDIASDSRTDRPALLAMIDIRALAHGRHELRIGRAPPATDDPIRKGSKAERDSQDYVIPFWK